MSVRSPQVIDQPENIYRRLRRLYASIFSGSTAQPHSALTRPRVAGPRPEGQPGHCCHSPNELAQGCPPVSGTCRSALSDGSGGARRNTAKPFAGHGSASPGRHLHRCLNRERADLAGLTRVRQLTDLNTEAGVVIDLSRTIRLPFCRSSVTVG